MEEQSSVVKNTSLSWIDDFGGGYLVLGFQVWCVWFQGAFFLCVGVVSGLFVCLIC